MNTEIRSRAAGGEAGPVCNNDFAISEWHDTGAVMEQLDKTETFETIPREDIFLAKDTLGRATLDALAAAELWLADKTVSEGE